MYRDQRTLIGFDAITKTKEFSTVEGLFDPLKSGHTVDEFADDFYSFLSDNNYKGYLRFESIEEEYGIEKRYVLPNEDLYNQDVFTHLSFTKNFEINDQTILTDDLSLMGNDNTYIIDYLDHEDYNKLPFTDSYLYVMPLSREHIPDD